MRINTKEPFSTSGFFFAQKYTNFQRIKKWKSGKYTGSELANMYNTSKSYIYSIVSGRKRKLALNENFK